MLSMMAGMGYRATRLMAACAAALVTVGVGTSSAGSVAVTGGVTELTSTSARLNGFANPSSADAAWFFQYFGAGHYHQTAPTAFSSPGAHAVSIVVNGLAPKSTYDFRLVVEQSDTETTQFTAGGALTFTTPATVVTPPRKPAYGRASLRSHRLIVTGGVASIPFACAGATGTHCGGRVSLSARATHGRRVNCGAGTLSAAAGGHSTVAVRLHGACASLLAKQARHRLRATLSASFSTHQAALQTGVTLIG